MLSAEGALQGAYVHHGGLLWIRHLTEEFLRVISLAPTLNWPYDGREKIKWGRIYNIWKGAQGNNNIIQGFLRVGFVNLKVCGIFFFLIAFTVKPSEPIRFNPRGSKTFQVKTVNNLIEIKINSWNHVSQSEAPESINLQRLIMAKDNTVIISFTVMDHGRV